MIVRLPPSSHIMPVELGAGMLRYRQEDKGVRMEGEWLEGDRKGAKEEGQQQQWEEGLRTGGNVLLCAPLDTCPT